MAGSVNKVILVGNLGRDPEVRYTQSNQKIVHLSVATSERWKDRQSGDPRERTEWHRVVIFNENLAGIAERYLSKGSPVYLEGTLQTRKWTGQGGQEHTTTEVVVPRFRGELTLLGGGAREGGGTEIGSPEDFGDTGYRSPAPSGPSERGPSDPSRGGHGRPTSIANLLAELAYLDAVIRITDPAAKPDTIRPKVPRNACDWFGRRGQADGRLGGDLAKAPGDAVATSATALEARA